MPYIWELKEWPSFTWKAEQLINLLGMARLAQGRLLSKVSSLVTNLDKESRAIIMVEEAVKTSEIEGRKPDYGSVRSSVAKRLGLPTAGLKKPDRYTEGLIDVIIDATANYSKTLTVERLKSWQAGLFPTGFSGIHKIKVGKWRGTDTMQVVSGPIGKEKVHFVAPPSDRLESEINDFIHWFEKKSQGIDGLLRAGIAHLYFVTIHPFEDGNGRITRVLTDMALAQDEKIPVRYYTLSSQIMEERNKYYAILEKIQKKDLDITEWLKWFLECYIRAVDKSEITISDVLKKSEFWQKHSQTIFNARQIKVINRMLDVGTKGFEGGMSTRKYVSMVRVSRATAYRELADLVDKGILVQRSGKGRSVSYDLNI